jgi:spore coat protein U-like protein
MAILIDRAYKVCAPLSSAAPSSQTLLATPAPTHFAPSNCLKYNGSKATAMSKTCAISAGGAAVVANGDATIIYGPIGASANNLITNTVDIFIPIANPPDPNAKLQNISVECDGTDAEVVNIVVTFGRMVVFTQKIDETSDFSVQVSKNKSVPDSQPYGIDVTLTLQLPNTCSIMNIHSVTLYFS